MKGFLLTALGAMACGCVQFDLPPLPLAVHISSDVPAEDQAAWRAAMVETNAAVGIEVMREGDGSGCGAYITRGDDLVGTNRVGRAQWKDDCQLTARIKPGPRAQRERVTIAIHEGIHLLLGINANDHSDDPASVMFEAVMPNTAITEEDVEKILAVVPDSMKAPVSP